MVWGVGSQLRLPLLPSSQVGAWDLRCPGTARRMPRGPAKCQHDLGILL